MDNNKTFGMFLKEHRQKINLTQKQLGEKLFVTESAVSKWERDKAIPDIYLIKELSELFGLTMEELVDASINLKKRKEAIEAKKYRNIKLTYNMFFFISFSITILTTFIVNLAVNKRLSWFFIVVASLLVASTLLLIPQFIKKHKVLFVPLSFFGSLILLLVTIAIITSSFSWLMITIVSLVLFYSIIFIPITIKKLDLPKTLKDNNAYISVILDIIIVLILMLTISIVKGGSGSWLIKIAIPIIIYVAVPALLTVVVLKQLPIKKTYKTSILIVMWTVFINTINLLLTKLNVENAQIGIFYKMNLTNWSTNELINNNVIGLVTITAIFIAVIFLIIGIFTKKENNKH